MLTIPFSSHATMLKELKPSFRPSTVLIAVNLRYKVRAGGFRFTGLPLPHPVR